MQLGFFHKNIPTDNLSGSPLNQMYGHPNTLEYFCAKIKIKITEIPISTCHRVTCTHPLKKIVYHFGVFKNFLTYCVFVHMITLKNTEKWVKNRRRAQGSSVQLKNQRCTVEDRNFDFDLLSNGNWGLQSYWTGNILISWIEGKVEAHEKNLSRKYGHM